jgi:hypothetical protein
MSDHMANATAALVEALTTAEPGATVGRLIMANYRDNVLTTRALIDSLQGMLADREAELAAIRTRINELFAGDYMPTESAILQAVFYPSRELIKKLRDRPVESS